MRLNHDLIRDIMLYVEENTDGSTGFVQLEHIVPVVNSTFDEVKYHALQLENAGFVGNVDAFFSGGSISKLTWRGHEYLDNIRDKTAWQMVKDGTVDLSSMSLNLVGQLSKELLFSYAKKKCGLE